MNVNTGELFRVTDEMIKELKKRLGDDLQLVPDELAGEADKELRGKDYTVVDMAKDSPLTQWARSERAKHRASKKAKRKMCKESRRKNRK